MSKSTKMKSTFIIMAFQFNEIWEVFRIVPLCTQKCNICIFSLSKMFFIIWFHVKPFRFISVTVCCSDDMSLRAVLLTFSQCFRSHSTTTDTAKLARFLSADFRLQDLLCEILDEPTFKTSTIRTRYSFIWAARDSVLCSKAPPQQLLR